MSIKKLKTKKGSKMRIDPVGKEKIDDNARLMKAELESLKKEISEIRKLGEYTKFAEELTAGCLPKIRMYVATGTSEDYNKVKQIFDEIKEEIKKIKSNEDNTYWKKDGML